MYFASKFFLSCDQLEFSLPAHQMVGIMGDPDRLHGIFGHFVK